MIYYKEGKRDGRREGKPAEERSKGIKESQQERKEG